ncbi:hypothetical protein AB0383_20610 [Amycolatopsis sp. NPDC051373]|uniref:hypothetical protein n=1 Tax=Amycolatopsis sp. NPDC051373 TaxID=3155801 RepID=UPI003450D5B8
MVFKYASPDVVAQQWAAAVVGVPTGDQLPADNSTWAASGFVVCSDTGGSSNPYYTFHESVYIFQCFAVNPNSPYPPWGEARNLTETIRNETYQHVGRFLTLPNCDQNAKVLQSQVIGRPRRGFGDFGDYAMYSIDVALHWIPA